MYHYPAVYASEQIYSRYVIVNNVIVTAAIIIVTRLQVFHLCTLYLLGYNIEAWLWSLTLNRCQPHSEAGRIQGSVNNGSEINKCQVPSVPVLHMHYKGVYIYQYMTSHPWGQRWVCIITYLSTPSNSIMEHVHSNSYADYNYASFTTCSLYFPLNKVAFSTAQGLPGKLCWSEMRCCPSSQ